MTNKERQKEYVIYIDERAITKYNGSMTSRRGSCGGNESRMNMAEWIICQDDKEGMYAKGA